MFRFILSFLRPCAELCDLKTKIHFLTFLSHFFFFHLLFFFFFFPFLCDFLVSPPLPFCRYLCGSSRGRIYKRSLSAKRSGNQVVDGARVSCRTFPEVGWPSSPSRPRGSSQARPREASPPQAITVLPPTPTDCSWPHNLV